MQRTQIESLVWEDPTCCRATKSMHHNYWACTLEPASHNYWAHMPQLLKPTCLEPMLHKREATAMRSLHTATKSSPRSPQLKKACTQQRRHNTAKNKNKLKKKKDSINKIHSIDPETLKILFGHLVKHQDMCFLQSERNPHRSCGNSSEPDRYCCCPHGIFNLVQAGFLPKCWVRISDTSSGKKEKNGVERRGIFESK